jgi:hypothetical protein
MAAMSGRAAAHVSAIGVIVVVNMLGRAGAYCSPVRADSYVFTSFGYRIAHGEVMYRDMNDAKPPGMFLLNAAVYLVAPPTRAAMIPMELAIMLLGCGMVFRAGRELYDRPAVGLILAVAAALAVNFFLLTDYTIEGFNLAENYMVLTSSAAMFAYIRAGRTRSTAGYFLVGLMLGLGFLLKQTVLPLVAAVALHHASTTLVVDRRPVWWAKSSAAIAAGVVVSLLPFALLLAYQGTLAKGAASTFLQASGHLQRDTAWPARWCDVLPLWVPLGWGVIGLGAYVMLRWSAARPPMSTPQTCLGPRPRPREIGFLFLWLGLECVMLVYLPRRGFHFYVLSCLPVVFLSGLLWSALLGATGGMAVLTRRAMLAVAAIWSVAFYRPTLDAFVPIVITRCQNYDAAADQARFEEALRWGYIDIG